MLARFVFKKLFSTLFLLVFVGSIQLLFAQDVQDSTNTETQQEESENLSNDNTQPVENNNETQFLIAPVGESTPIQTISIWDTVRVFVVLGIVLLCVYLFVVALKKIQKKSFINSDVINIVSSRSLTGNGSVHLVKVGKSLLLLGSTSQAISMLKEIKDKEEIDELQLDISFNEKNSKLNPSFLSKIRSKMGGRQQNKPVSSSYTETLGILKNLFKRPVTESKVHKGGVNV